jgi:hypothetical protein
VSVLVETRRAGEGSEERRTLERGENDFPRSRFASSLTSPARRDVTAEECREARIVRVAAPGAKSS